MRFWLNIHGNDGEGLYLTRIYLTPLTRRGRLMLHIFHRVDPDPDPHDHPFDFWTFPLQTYIEEVMTETGALQYQVVPRLKWRYCRAEYAHRIVGCIDGWPRVCGWRFLTIVWHRPERKPWGFWEYQPETTRFRSHKTGVRGQRIWVSWRAYLECKARGRA